MGLTCSSTKHGPAADRHILSDNLWFPGELQCGVFTCSVVHWLTPLCLIPHNSNTHGTPKKRKMPQERQASLLQPWRTINQCKHTYTHLQRHWKIQDKVCCPLSTLCCAEQPHSNCPSHHYRERPSDLSKQPAAMLSIKVLFGQVHIYRWFTAALYWSQSESVPFPCHYSQGPVYFTALPLCLNPYMDLRCCMSPTPV